MEFVLYSFIAEIFLENIIALEVTFIMWKKEIYFIALTII